MGKKYSKPQSPQGEAAPGPQPGAGFKTWGHQHGNAAHRGGGETPDARYEGDAASAAAPNGSNPPYRYKGQRVKDGKAGTFDSHAVPGHDAEPNVGMDYDGEG